ncbi:MAG TPA: ABC transporter ATP-binding protein [Candidatus Blautia faecigallinarum]|uniref:ABC transporter ATP-binding protein n=1 Tax=Candidatus Blautia faecigallinarum TaxID=2838488 RepID=A0A9D2ITJ6_9FIRM|nr:ABC transporter ATP-binding protein [Candidatus Blautia faecigallinarum]
MSAISTEKLTKFYGKIPGIRELDLSVKEGEFFGFIGPNGAGKSTTIRTLLGLIHPTSGQASVLGMDIRKEKSKILSRTGYLPAEAVFYPGMKVKEVLKLSADLRKKDCSREAASLCSRLDLDPERRVDELSFGNRKKAGIIAALQHKPELLILDEPTSGLDPLMQQEFFSILRERNRQGTTIFLSSHILSEIQKNCSRAAIVRSGRLIACGSVEELAKTNARRVTLRGRIDLKGLEGVRNVRQTDSDMSFLYTGEIPSLLHVLSEGNVTDLSITEPDLEEIFMHYYQQEEQDL